MKNFLFLGVNYLLFFSQSIFALNKEYAIKFPNNCTGREVINTKLWQAKITYNKCSPCRNNDIANATSIHLLSHTRAPVPTARPRKHPTHKPTQITATPKPNVPNPPPTTLPPVAPPTLPPAQPPQAKTKKPSPKRHHHPRPPQSHHKPTCPPTHAKSEQFTLTYKASALRKSHSHDITGLHVIFPDGCTGHQMLYANGTSIIQLNNCTICGPAITKSPHSLRPTSYPTGTPSSSPSTTPTLMPSLAPTLMPTTHPTKHPTKHPRRPPKPPTRKPTCGCQDDIHGHNRQLLFAKKVRPKLQPTIHNKKTLKLRK